MTVAPPLKFCAVGDITAFHKQPESGYEFVGPVLAEMDVVVWKAVSEWLESAWSFSRPDYAARTADP